MDISLRKLFGEAIHQFFKDKTKDNMFRAIEKDDAAEVSRILKKHDDARNWVGRQGAYQGKCVVDACLIGKHYNAANEIFAHAPFVFREGDDNQRTPLHRIASVGIADSINYLVKTCGVAVDKEDKDGKTPLMLAAKSGGDWEKASQALIDAGADIFKADKSGKNIVDQMIDASALDAAVKFMRLGVKADLNNPALQRAINVANYETNVDFLQEITRQKNGGGSGPAAAAPIPK